MKTLLVLVTLVAATTSCKKRDVPAPSNTAQVRANAEEANEIRSLKERVLILEAQVDILKKSR
jgi:hypothetical protein